MTVTEAYTSRPTVGAFSGLSPLLGSHAVVLQASTFTGSDGDDWPNGGTLRDNPGVPNSLDPLDSAVSQPAFYDLQDSVRFYHPLTTANFDGILTAPSSAAAVPTSGFFACGKGRAIAPAGGIDPFEDTGEPQFPWSLTTKGITAGAPGTEEMETQHLNVGIRPSDGAVLIGWWGNDGDFDEHREYLDPAEPFDVYEDVEIAGSLLCNDGAGNHVATAYIRDDDNPDLTANGRGWRIVATETIAGTTSLRSTDGGHWGACIGRGFHDYVEWYDWNGTTATLILSCHPDAAGLGPGDTFDTDGVTWTLGDGSATVEGVGFGSGAFSGQGRIQVEDHASLHPGTNAFTAWVWITPTAQAVPDEFTPVIYIDKLSGVLGGGGIGWQFQNLTVPGFGLAGLNFAFSDGTGLSLTSGAVPEDWVGNPHLVVLKRVGGVGSVWIDGVPFGTSLASGATGSLSNSTDLTLLNGSIIGAVTFGHAYGYIGRALTDTEATVTLPTDLGFP